MSPFPAPTLYIGTLRTTETMIDPEGIEGAAREIAARNNLEIAKKYCWLIGDTPELVEDGRVIVRNESGQELARIILPVG